MLLRTPIGLLDYLIKKEKKNTKSVTVVTLICNKPHKWLFSLFFFLKKNYNFIMAIFFF
jgi:hypothetical protein